MSNYNEWDKAIEQGPATKRKLLAKDIEDKRSRSKLPPEETERILALYEKFSLENFRLSEGQLENNSGDERFWLVSFAWIAVVVIIIAIVVILT